jgi:hypothetical protein
LDRLVRSLKNSGVHLMVNVLSFVITFSSKLYVHLFVCTIVITNLYVHLGCMYISIVCTFLYVQLYLQALFALYVQYKHYLGFVNP